MKHIEKRRGAFHCAHKRKIVSQTGVIHCAPTCTEDNVAAMPDPGFNADNELRSLGDALIRISRILHEHTHKLEVAVEGTYAGEASDDRVRLLSDSLRVCRTADLELSRFSQAGQRVINTLREQLEQAH